MGAAVLTIMKNGEMIQSQPIESEVVLGRAQGCVIRLEDRMISRQHAVFRPVLEGIQVEKKSDFSPLVVNGVECNQATLKAGDVISIGPYLLRLDLPKSEELSKTEPVAPSLPEAAPENFQPLELKIDETSGSVSLALDPPEPLDEAGKTRQMTPEELAQLQEIPALPEVAHPQPTEVAAPVASLVVEQTPSSSQTTNSLSEFAGVPGIGEDLSVKQSKKKTSLMERYRALPKNKQAVYGIAFLALFYFLFIDEDTPIQQNTKKKPPTQPQAKATALAPAAPAAKSAPLPMTFESLTEEQRKFVEVHHNLSFQHFVNKDYDRALDEISKVLVYVSDYKDSREIQRFAQEGKRKLEALAEERRKKEEEAALKAKIEKVVSEARSLMAQKKYEQAKEKFGELLALEPDNQLVVSWKKEIEEFEEEKRRKEQERQVQQAINQRAWEMFKEGLALYKQGKFHQAIAQLTMVGDIGATDQRPKKKAQALIASSKKSIRDRRDPVLQEAKELENSGDLPKAFALYKKATRIDPPHSEGYAGMKRIRGILHHRAKLVYTEAVLAESYSDFSTAKKKYQECLGIAPEDDIYHERAQHKLSHYLNHREDLLQ